MLRLIFLFSLIIFLVDTGLSQYLPQSYSLTGEEKLSKLNAETPASNSISDIITVDDTIVWLGTGRGVSLSTDRGETWTNFYGSEAFGDASISAIGYNNEMFWAAIAGEADVPGGGTLPEGKGFRYTTDNGQTWTSIPQPVDDPGDSLITYGINDGVNLPRVRALPVTVTVQNLTYDMAFTPGTIWITSFAGGLRKSTDNGQTWQRVLLPSDEVNEISPDDTIRFSLQPVAGNFGSEDNLNHRVFSVVAINETLYVGTAGGINKSTDNGISWVKFTHQNQSEPISGNFVVALGYNQMNNTVWAATWRAETPEEFHGVSSSTNGGETWETFLEEEMVHNFGFSYDDVIAPSDDGAFRTSNQGITWILPNSIVDDETGIPFLRNVFYSASSRGNNILLGSNDGLLSLDENVGTMWQGKWKIYFASQPLKSRNETYAFPNPFSPKLDEFVDIKYSTGGKNSSVTIRIFDFDMNYVATVVQNSQRGNPTHEVDNFNLETNGVIDKWNGRDDKGNIVPNGVYFYRVEVGDDEPVYGKILVLQ